MNPKSNIANATIAGSFVAALAMIAAPAAPVSPAATQPPPKRADSKVGNVTAASN